jgi:catechol 2,3-dioxygenase-like lactoylglutathione lyase family enzyme
VSEGGRIDVGLTHVALAVADMDEALAFYEKYADMQIVHERRDPDARVVWISDLTRAFVVVLAQGVGPDTQLGPFGHLGIGCRSAADVERRAELARAEGCLVLGPHDSGAPLGYWAMLRDPDGNMLELSYGQQTGLAVEQAGG